MARSRIIVDAKKELFPMGDMYGIFFEDISHAADGGLYAEMVQNRSFEYCGVDNPSYNRMTAWKTVERDGGVFAGGVESEYPINVYNTHYMRMRNTADSGSIGIMNEGYNSGLPYEQGKYLFSMFARRDINWNSPVEIRLESADGSKLYGSAVIKVSGPEWTKYEAEIECCGVDHCGRLVILMSGIGDLCVDMISLFPENTFHGRKNGLRPDLAKYLEELRPSFMRFPGGCLTHAGAVDDKARNSMYRWKNSIGKLEERPSKANNWRYNQTLGFGYYEFLCFCEDIGTKPLPVLPGAYNPHSRAFVPMDEMQPWIDDALDFIEFVTGPADSKWGAVRAEMGHPEPFELEYLAIGNEETDKEFFDRYPLFHKAISEKYPNIKLLNTAGPFAQGRGFFEGWQSARENGSYGVDEHYYVTPDWMLENYERYASDFYDENGPKVFLGEYASNGNTHKNALAEAAYMTSFERNADVVALTCYAPLFCNADYVNWQPNLIWFNNHETFAIPSYYTQKLFSVNKGDMTLDIRNDISPEDAAEPERHYKGLIGLNCPIEINITDMKLNGETVDEFSVKRLQWTAGNGCVSKGCEPPPANPFNRGPSDTDITFGSEVENFVWEFKFTSDAHQDMNRPVINGRPNYRRDLSFIICESADDSFAWSMGGFMNDSFRFSRRVDGKENRLDAVPHKLEDGKEYSVRIEKQGNHFICSLDGEIIHDVTYVHEEKRIYTSATIDHETNEVIIKAVNYRETPAVMDICVENAGDGSREVSLESMTGDYAATNDFDDPLRVSPAKRVFTVEGLPFEVEFAPRSVNVLRIPVKQ